MRRGELFWGPLLVLLGVLFFMKTAGYITGDVFSWFWPFFVIAVGVWILLGGLLWRSHYETAQKFSIPLQGATEGSLSIQHGAGRIELQAGANPGDFLTGVSAAGMSQKTRLDGSKLHVEIEAGPSFMPFIGPDSGMWQYRLTPDVPMRIRIESGASRLDMDLTDLLVNSFSFEGGASSLNLKLPARVENVSVDIDAGAAGIDVGVPEGVSIRLRSKGPGSVHVDTQRFPMRETGLYQSADYDTARNRADITVDGGATSLSVH